MSNLFVYLILGILITVFSCNGCDHDDEETSSRQIVCNDTTVIVSKVKGNIKRYRTYNNVAHEITGFSGYFTVNSSSDRKIKLNLPLSCKHHMHLYIKALMEPDDFMQANRDRYEGAMCTPKKYYKIQTSFRPILFGMKVANSTTSISNFTVGYVCHIPNMAIQAELIFSCPQVVSYIMNSSEALQDLASYLSVSSATNQSKDIGRHLCTIFKYVKNDCNLNGFDHIDHINC